MAHLARGFHRVGVVLATPMILAPALVAYHGWSDYGPWTSYQDGNTHFEVAGLILGGAVALYGACRAIGWVVHGTVTAAAVRKRMLL